MTENKKYKLKEHPELVSRIGAWLCMWGKDGKFELSETDIQWIERNITTHRLFRAIENKVYAFGHPNVYVYIVEFLKMFLDTPKIPLQVNKLLYYAIGICKAYDEDQYSAPIEPEREFFIRRWMETCR